MTVRISWIVVVSLFYSVAFAEVQISNGKMTVNVIDERLDNVLDILREQTGIQVYLDDRVKDQPICADFDNLSIGPGIKKLLEGTGINYAVIANRGKIKRIFIGDSRKPQVSDRKVDTRSAGNWRKQTIYYTPQAHQTPPPARNTVSGEKHKAPMNRVAPVASVPTAGQLMASPGPQGKNKKE